MSLKRQLSYEFLCESAPMPAAILEAGTLKLKVANQHMLDLWERPASVLNTPLLDFMPEIEGQLYPQYLHNVIRTGLPHAEKAARVFLNLSGKEQLVYMDYSYTPVGDPKKPNAILVIANDVSERELNRVAIQQSERNIAAIVISAPVAMCIYECPGFKIEAVNHRMLDLWQDTRKMNLKALSYVFHSGIPYTFEEKGIQYSYTPLFDATGKVIKISSMAVPT